MKNLFTLVCFLLIVCLQFSYSQWEPCNNGIHAEYINALAISGNNVFASVVSERGVFFSSDNGNNWTHKDNGVSARTFLKSRRGFPKAPV